MKTVTIESIELVNFMCHSNLKVAFDKMITCIGGRNGTGKSAIMIALGILFGQRAQSLERGNSFKCLIKTGKNQATIKVVINNNLNYKKERYGDKITIEKKLREGSTSVSIYTSHGKIFKTSKNELSNIIEKFGLKFENPLNFLTQEKSKKFLNISSAEDLYDFYYLGTEFKDIEDELNESMNILKEINSKIEEVIKDQERLETNIDVQAKNLEFLEFDPETALEKLQIEEKWINIVNNRNKMKEMQTKIDEYNDIIHTREKERSEVINANNITFVEESVVSVEEELSKLKIQHHDVKNELNEYIVDRNKILTEVEKIKSRNNTGMLENKYSELQDILQSKKERLSELEASRPSLLQAYQDEKSENAEKDNMAFSLKKQLEYLKQNAMDQNKQKKHQDFSKIEMEIKRNNFKDIIIGPVCNYVKLKEYKWYKTVSIILNKTLTNYIVFNSEDKLRLLGIFNRIGVEYSVTQMKSKTPYMNLHENKKFKTLLSVLDVNNHFVSNQLITLNSVEQIILVEDRENAHRIIRNNPDYVDCAYILTGDKIKLMGGSLSDFRPKDDGSYWFEDQSSKIRKLEMDIKNLEKKDDCRTAYNQLMHEMSALTYEVDNIEVKMRNLQIEIQSLKGFEGEDLEGHEKKLHILSRGIQSLESKRIQLEEQIERNETIRRSIIDKNIRGKDKYLKEKEENALKIKNIDYEIMGLENYKSMLIRDRRDLNLAISTQVNELGEEPKILKTVDEIQREKRRINEFKIQTQNMQSKEEIEKQIQIMNNELQAILRLRNKFEQVVKDTEEAYKKRIEKRNEIKFKNTEEAVKLFKEYTSRNGYVGEMMIDHDRKRIDLRMKVHNSSISGSKNTLSGGERSFAGVCFLLSMWKCFKCPVKVLDEFDVFMDSINRKMAIRSLFEFFKETSVQVILITPLDTSDLLDPDCDIKILKKGESGDS